MEIICDFHVHSKFSRATSKNMTLEGIAEFAFKKGINVIATGDFVHPGWLRELKEKLVESEPGLFKLREIDNPTRFILSTEISSIYKKKGKVRKIHNVIIMPSLEEAEKFSKELDRIGNITSDGRPILGLDSKNLISLVFDISKKAIFIPAHIWTPWFSLFGQKSGFDDIEECFEDYTKEIFALETGLSSDPPMNWLWSRLDSFTLVSNSDAHSPAKIGREANLISINEFDYYNIRKSIQNKSKVSTIEFFPEEGKYHYDGHRKCGVRLTPEEAEKLNNLCPVCGRELTKGVFHRIIELADRKKPIHQQRFFSFIPLEEILAQILGTKTNTLKVKNFYNRLINDLGNEIRILKDISLSDIKYAGGELLRLGIEKMRKGEVKVEPGFDGEYGRIIVITDEERQLFKSKKGLFVSQKDFYSNKVKDKKKNNFSLKNKQEIKIKSKSENLTLKELDEFQEKAVTSEEKFIIVEAGPGSGKTFTLTKRVEYLLEKNEKPEKIFVITFTNKACDELKERISDKKVNIFTIHSFAIYILKQFNYEFKLLDPEKELIFIKDFYHLSQKEAIEFLNQFSLYKKNMTTDLLQDFNKFDTLLKNNAYLDFDDIIIKASEQIKKNNIDFIEHLLVDEFQDIDELQFNLIKEISVHAKSVFLIGDPDQSIYGFRGAKNIFFEKFSELFPVRKFILENSYRCPSNILNLSLNILGRKKKIKSSKKNGDIQFFQFFDETEEAKFIINTIKRLTGGLDFHTSSSKDDLISFKDIAILFRLHFISKKVEKILEENGIPFQKSDELPYFENQNLNFKAEKVNLLSFHAAKGLEFKAVFIIGIDNGIVPYGDDFNEERRLMFVALTRAKEKLFILSAKKRFLYGEILNKGVSKFFENYKFSTIRKEKKGFFY